jgi:hypothetical protein
MEEAWQRYWFQPVPPHAYALLRILFGVAGCAGLIGLADVSTFWSLEGFVPLDGPIAPLKGWLLANGLGGVAGGVVWAFSLGTFACMTVGLRSQFTVPLAFAVLVFQTNWNHLPLSGTHTALRVFLFCLIWTDSGAVWSLDAWRRQRRSGRPADAAPERLWIAPLRLLRFQVAVIYLSAGLWKLQSALWRDGTAVHYVLSYNVYQRVPGALAPELGWLTVMATYVTLFWELAFAFLVLYGPTRRVALLAGVGIHAGMFVMMEVGLFHFIMLAAYVSFLDPWRVAALGTQPGSGGTRTAGDGPSLPERASLSGTGQCEVPGTVSAAPVLVACQDAPATPNRSVAAALPDSTRRSAG